MVGTPRCVAPDAQATIASLWFRRQNNRYRIEAEAVTIQGMVGSFATKAEDVGNPAVEDIDISQFGAALETEYKLAKDKLVVGLTPVARAVMTGAMGTSPWDRSGRCC